MPNQTAKIVRFHSVGGPEVLKIEELPIPEPEKGDFKPRIDRVFPFAQIVEAHRYMESNEQIGKIVVTA
jgi:NADPH:quinone reductase-like Zn-dependent oxidoreductase